MLCGQSTKKLSRFITSITCQHHHINFVKNLDFLFFTKPVRWDQSFISSFLDGSDFFERWDFHFKICKQGKINLTFMHRRTRIHPPTPSTSTSSTLAQTLITVTPSSKSSIWSRGKSIGEQRSFKWYISFTFWHIKTILKRQGHEYCTAFCLTWSPSNWRNSTVMLWSCKTLELCLINTCVHLGE